MFCILNCELVYLTYDLITHHSQGNILALPQLFTARQEDLQSSKDVALTVKKYFQFGL